MLRGNFASAGALFFTVIFSAASHAQLLSETALFHRCFTQITSLKAKPSEPLLGQVQAGQKTAVNACIEVLQRATFTANGNNTIANQGDPVAKGIVATFHRLHSSWFNSKDYPVVSWPGHTFDIQDLYESSSPALYFTRALFRPGTPATDAVTTNEFLEGVRSNQYPGAGAASGHPLADFLFTTPFKFAPVGELTGVQPIANNEVAYAAFNSAPAGSVALYPNYGGGFLGTNSYLLLNIASLSSYDEYKTDGNLVMHRKWGKAVYHDTLCRDLPVVRTNDVSSMIDVNSPTPFRTSVNCTKCHASHDRMAAVIRGMKVRYIGGGDPTGYGEKLRGGVYPQFHTVTMPAEGSWPSQPDSDYYRRPGNGVLYFRNHEGALIDQPVSGLSDLGQKIAQTDDYHICLAKRYYAYFTGIEVDTGDLQDPEHIPAPTTEDLKHRKIVVTLGKNLKTHQSIMQMIGDILRLPHYKRLDVGTGGGVVAQ